MPTCALPAAASEPVTVARISYQGWPDSVLLSNGIVEAVIVPAVGRIMQFRFAGSAEGPFWENTALRGSQPDSAVKEWSNFGGDKAWPAPQADWLERIGRRWPPPGAFDGRPMEARVDPAGVTLLSPVDPHYGMRVRRRIELVPGQPAMTVVTSFQKVGGRALEAAVWTVTQLQDPVAIYALPPPDGRPGPAFVKQSDELPPSLAVIDGRLSLTRDPARNHKIGVPGGTLVWIGAKTILRLEAAVVPGARYPDGGCRAEIYTQADPQRYVELELLGPLGAPPAGEALELRVTYTLERRREQDAEAEIRALLRR